MVSRAVFSAACLAAFLPAAAGAQSDPSQAGCRLRLESSRSSWIIHGYDPFGADAPIDEFELMFVNDGEGECRVRPIFDLDQEAYGLDQGGGPRVAYSLVDRTSGYDVTPRSGTTATNPNNPPVVIAPHAQQSVHYRFTVTTDNLIADGFFTQNVRATAQTDSGGIAASRRLSLGIEVKPSALIGLSGSFRLAQGRAMVDLGELQRGLAPVVLNLYVQSTRGYTVRVDSENVGTLKLPNSGWSIPYQIVLGDRMMTLGGTAAFTSTLGTALARQSLPLNFAIGDVAARRAGTYSDVITITVAVN